MQDRTTHPEEGPASPPPAVTLKERQALSRRLLLGTLGVTAAGGALAMVSYQQDAQAATTSEAAAATATPAATGAEHAWCMVIDLRTCDGCKACTMSCQSRHELRDGADLDQRLRHEGQLRRDVPHAAALHDVRGPSVHVRLPGRGDHPHRRGTRPGRHRMPASGPAPAWRPARTRRATSTGPTRCRQKRMPMPSSPADAGGHRRAPSASACSAPTGCRRVSCPRACPAARWACCTSATSSPTSPSTAWARPWCSRSSCTTNDAVRYKEELGTNPRVYYIAGHGQTSEARE